MAIPRQRIRLPKGAIPTALVSIPRGDLWRGDAIAEFERAFAALVGAEHAVVTASGRAGLAAILESLDLPEGSEIICPAFGYPVVPHLVRSMGYTLRLVDCSMPTLGFDPAALDAAASERTAAIIVMHLFGVPAPIDAIGAIAERVGARLIEDCAHCLGASVGGRHVGTIGDVGYFSFETSKMINTLGGGILTTNDGALAERLRARLEGETDRTLKWLVERLARTAFEDAVTSPLGFNAGVYPALRLAARNADHADRFASGYQADHFTMKGRTGRYTNYQARLGLAQLRAHERTLERRVRVAESLIERLGGRVEVQRPGEPDAIANYLLVTALIPDRPAVAARLLRRGVDTKHHYMRDCSRALETGETFPFASRAEQEVLHLPAFPGMSRAQVRRVADAVLSETGADAHAVSTA
jgi:perosamine synthetase